MLRPNICVTQCPHGQEEDFHKSLNKTTQRAPCAAVTNILSVSGYFVRYT
jgi:hypothetical protein